MGPAVTRCPAVRAAVCYDGNWSLHVTQFFARVRRTPISLAGLHNAIRWHAVFPAFRSSQYTRGRRTRAIRAPPGVPSSHGPFLSQSENRSTG